MLEDSLDIKYLIQRVLEGVASSEEIHLLQSKFEESEDIYRPYLKEKNKYDILNPAFDVSSKDTEQAWKKMEVQLKLSEQKKLTTSKFSIFIKQLQRVASVLLLPLLFFTGYYIFYQRGADVVYQEVYSPAGMRSKVNLPDGSIAWLNSKSSIRFPIDMSYNRAVAMEGEAYFEVKKDILHKFSVAANNINVVVTGTEFNINAYKSESGIAVTLVKGGIDIQLPNSDEFLSIKPSEKIDIDVNTMTYNIENTNTYKWTSWKDGVLAFRDDTFEDVCKRISNYYSVDIQIMDEEVHDYIFRATFEYESIEEILRLLSFSAPISWQEIVPEKHSTDEAQPKRLFHIYKN